MKGQCVLELQLKKFNKKEMTQMAQLQRDNDNLSFIISVKPRGFGLVASH
jgi:hypothetical protein